MRNHNDLIKSIPQQTLTAKGCKLKEKLIQKGLTANSIIMGGSIYLNGDRKKIRETLNTAFNDMVFHKNKSYNELNNLIKSIKVNPLTPIEITQ